MEMGVQLSWIPGSQNFIDLMTRNLRVVKPPASVNVNANDVSAPSNPASTDKMLTRLAARRQAQTTLTSVLKGDANGPEVILECIKLISKEDSCPKKSSVFSNGVWMFTEPEEGQTLIVVPDDMLLRIAIVLNEHCQLMGHPGIESTYLRLKRRYFWPGMKSLVSDIVKECMVCKTAKGPTSLRYPLGSLPRGARPFDRIAFDFGEMKPSLTGNVAFLLVVCTFSGLCAVFPTADRTAQTAVRCLLEWCKWYPDPYELHSDAGPAFIADVWKAMVAAKQQSHAFSHPEVKSTNGYAERSVESVKQVFRAIMFDLMVPENQWDTVAELVQYALAHTPRPPHGLTPSEKALRIPGRTPIQVLFNQDRNSIKVAPLSVQEIEALKAAQLAMTELHQRLDETLIKEELRIHARSKFHTIPLPLSMDSWVLVASEYQKGLRPRWDRLCQIKSVENNWTYEVEDILTREVTREHVSRLRPFASSNFRAQLSDKELLSYFTLQKHDIAGISEFRFSKDDLPSSPMSDTKNKNTLYARVHWGTPTTHASWVQVRNLVSKVPYFLKGLLCQEICKDQDVHSVLTSMLPEAILQED